MTSTASSYSILTFNSDVIPSYLSSLAWSVWFTHSGEKSRHPWPCMSNPGAGVSGTVYFRLTSGPYLGD